MQLITVGNKVYNASLIAKAEWSPVDGGIVNIYWLVLYEGKSLKYDVLVKDEARSFWKQFTGSEPPQG
jgi:hypothetical protein